jgi:hypothetical protein
VSAVLILKLYYKTHVEMLTCFTTKENEVFTTLLFLRLLHGIFIVLFGMRNKQIEVPLKKLHVCGRT